MPAPRSPVTGADQILVQAVTLHRAGRLEEAEALYRAVLREAPNNFDALHLAGTLAVQRKRPAEGVDLITRALALRPDEAGAHANLALGLRDLGRGMEALAHCDRAMELQPDHPGLLANRRSILRQLGRSDAPDPAQTPEQAEEADTPEADLARTRRALVLRPNDVGLLRHMVTLLAAQLRWSEAVPILERLIRLRPGDVEAMFHLTTFLTVDVRLEEALRWAQATLRLTPTHAGAFAAKSMILAALRRTDEALEAVDQAIALEPESWSSHYAKAIILLRAGRYREGWPWFEARKPLAIPARAHDLPGPAWDGTAPLAGKRLLLYCEQGLGDTLQFCRYAPLALEAGADVTLVVQPSLVRLMRSLHPRVEILSSQQEIGDYHLHCALMSLPRAFGTTVETIPAPIPYLHADPDATARWRARLAELAGRKVGLVWSGASRPENPAAYATDLKRSLALPQLAPLAAVKGVSFVSLQKGPAAAQAATPPAGMVLHDWTDELEDFADTAALVAALDLVITVDSAVLHLAGALGRPVWAPDRYDHCWRWLLGREDSPWYPTLRLFRQAAPNAWEPVMERLSQALREWAGGEAPR